MKKSNLIERVHEAETNEEYYKEKCKETKNENKFLKKKLKYLKELYANMKMKTPLLLQYLFI